MCYKIYASINVFMSYKIAVKIYWNSKNYCENQIPVFQPVCAFV